jgi:hypothetical protein
MQNWQEYVDAATAVGSTTMNQLYAAYSNIIRANFIFLVHTWSSSVLYLGDHASIINHTMV